LAHYFVENEAQPSQHSYKAKE